MRRVWPLIPVKVGQRRADEPRQEEGHCTEDTEAQLEGLHQVFAHMQHLLSGTKRAGLSDGGAANNDPPRLEHLPAWLLHGLYVSIGPWH